MGFPGQPSQAAPLPQPPLYRCLQRAVSFPWGQGARSGQEWPGAPTTLCRAPHHPGQAGSTQSHSLSYPGCRPKGPRQLVPVQGEGTQLFGAAALETAASVQIPATPLASSEPWSKELGSVSPP